LKGGRGKERVPVVVVVNVNLVRTCLTPYRKEKEGEEKEGFRRKWVRFSSRNA